MLRMLALLALLFVAVPARAAGLVVWWQAGYYPAEDDAVREMVAAFEGKSGVDVELDFLRATEMLKQLQAAFDRGNPPDFAYNSDSSAKVPQWAYEDRLVELGDTLGSLAELFDQDMLDAATLLDARTGRRALYGLPMTRAITHVHVWRGLLQQAGFKLDDVPRDWRAFWSFWCEQVQPALRKAMGREDVWGVAMPMSISEIYDTPRFLNQFLLAHTAAWQTPTGPSIVHDPVARDTFVTALREYADIYRKGCTPPDSVDWNGYGNNAAFLAQRVVTTINGSLSIPNELRATRPEDYYRNAVTLDWPLAVSGQPLRIVGDLQSGVVFAGGGHVDKAKDFVHFLVAEGWLAHWLSFAGDRYLPPLRNLLEQPFWLDPSDPHRLRSAVQGLTQQHVYGWWGIARDEQRQFGAADPPIYGLAVHRVAAEGWTPEQAVDEAITRIKQILGE